ncbi:surface polysaccharide polymerase [Rhodopseudomonas sp. HC1]|uniref:surface polysaccharide polymerase n=1 Tax=Rhodopseudomonas infernalis TaxID=2897386 RepID=UPI001EE99765|nr:surface polysaccharide polymerase [Rhodopseudomonas infernalis]MCG6203123.1 surface polysaccharide polymerase [Rhodopseudomonas infernalis]
MTEISAQSSSIDGRHNLGTIIAVGIVISALTFNLVLSFVNASISHVSSGAVIAVELLLIGAATLMILNRSESFLIVSIAVSAWLIFEMLIRYQYDPKAFRDAFIPIIFFYLGRSYASPASADRLVTIAILIVVAGALFEWMFLDVFLKYVDVIGYYVARGSVDASASTGAPGLFISGLRFEGRTLLPFLGEHRVSSVFLEPVSLGNFGAIAFAWTLLRDRRNPVALIAKTIGIAVILILGDARFGFYLCGVVLLTYLIAPIVRPAMAFALPFLVVIGLLWYAGAMVGVAWDNTTTGRFLLSGQLLSTLDLGQALGLKITTIDFDDSGYSYMLSRFGVVGAASLWALYVFGSPAETMESWRFKLFVCVYLVLLLSISTSSVTIKTGALLWFLAGSIATGYRPAPQALHE